MFASLLPIVAEDISLIHPHARDSVFWEFEASVAQRVYATGCASFEKEAWLLRVLFEYGTCGFNISSGEQTPALATILFCSAPDAPGAAALPTAPVTNGADLISSLFVEQGFEGLGFEGLLIDAALHHLTSTGSRLVEAFGVRDAETAAGCGVGWGVDTPQQVGLIPEGLLVAAGFEVVKDHEVLPRLQITLPPPHDLMAVEEAEELIRQALITAQT